MAAAIQRVAKKAVVAAAQGLAGNVLNDAREHVLDALNGGEVAKRAENYLMVVRVKKWPLEVQQFVAVLWQQQDQNNNTTHLIES